MRLYLPRVEARLRGITAWWFCRKKGHLHTIPCNEQEWDKELAYNRHFTQYINITHTSSKIQAYRPTTVKIQMKIRQPQMLDPRSSQLGSTTDHQEKTHSNDHLRSISSTALASSAPATVLVESVSHRDSAISHPRDQDYLSL